MNLSYGISRAANVIRAFGIIILAICLFGEYAYVIIEGEAKNQGRPLTVGIIMFVMFWIIGFIVKRFGQGEFTLARSLRFLGMVCLVFGLGSQAYFMAGLYLYVDDKLWIEAQNFERYGNSGIFYGVVALAACFGFAYITDGLNSKKKE